MKIRRNGIQETLDVADSGERDYTPGRVPKLINVADGAGEHIVYDNRTQIGGGVADINGNYGSGTGFRIRRLYAVPVTRTGEEPPVLTWRVLNAAGALVRTLEIVAAISERTFYTVPADCRLVLHTDIAARVTCRATIEEL